jgi:hypothetical protein
MCRAHWELPGGYGAQRPRSRPLIPDPYGLLGKGVTVLENPFSRDSRLFRVRQVLTLARNHGQA